MDCDLSHPPELLTAMYDYCTWMNADCVLASRYLPSSIDKTHQGKLFIKIHKLLSFMLNKICQFLISQITDYTSGYIMVHRKRLETIDYSGDYGEYFMELCGNLKPKMLHFEVPFYSPPRKHGQSKTATHILVFFKWTKIFAKNNLNHISKTLSYRELNFGQRINIECAVKPQQTN